MKATRKFFASVLLLAACYAPAQFTRPLSEYVPPEKAFHTLFDQDGKKYSIEDLQVKKPGEVVSANPGKKYSSNKTNVIGSMSSAGYFDLYFEAGSLCDVNASAKACCEQVFKDLSNFIVSPLSNPNNAVRVNIYISNYPGVGPGLVAGASSFFGVPFNPTNPDQGLVDGMVYKTIVSGTDPYNTLPLGLPVPVPNSPAFYHGMVQFATSLSMGTWNFNYTGGIAPSDVDFYTTTLHEAIHMLGFRSLISGTGVSSFGAANNYYHRYDAFLCDASGNPLLSQPSPCTTGTGITYTASTGLLNPGNCPGTTNTGTCNTSIRFISPNVDVKVYNPECFEPASSLHHFEDKCVMGYANPGGCISNVPPNYADDLYYLMSNNGGLGQCFVKRYPKVEERYTLCDLGYTMNSSYASTDPSADIDGGFPSYNYGLGSCNPVVVSGVNDGLVNTLFTYNTTGSSLNIPLIALLSNDISTNPLSVTCVDVIYVNGFNNASASILGSNLVVNASVGCGLVIVKYIPQDNVGVNGNATYVFVQFLAGGCNPPGNCNLVQNGGFELLSGGGISPDCGRLNIELPSNSIACWDIAEGNPHVFTRNCSANTVYELGVNTVGSANYITDSFNGTGNDRVMGLYATYVSGVLTTQAMKNYLSSPLIPGGQYKLSFAALNALSNVSGYNVPGTPVVITVASLPVFGSPITSPYPTGLNILAQFTIPAATTWSLVERNFTFSSPGNMNHSALVIGINPAGSTIGMGFGLFCYIDEVSILPNPWPGFSISNAPICGTQSLPNLQQYASIPGTFSGPAVSFNGTQYDFNLGQNLSPGVYPIGYTYNFNGCTNTMYQFVTVSTNTVLLALTQSVCASNMTLNLPSLLTNTVPGSTSFSVNGTATTGVVVFPTQGSYTITVQNASTCNGTASVVVMAYPFPSQPMINTTNTGYCYGDPSVTLTAVGSSMFYLWMPGSVLSNTLSVTPTVSTTYTVYSYDGASCATINTYALNVSTVCCQTSLPLYGANPYGGNTLPGGFYNTPMAFVSDVTLAPGSTVIFDDVECVFAPGVRLIVTPGSSLILRGVHFYSCGTYLWKGIEIQNGGYLNTTIGTGLYNNHNLIEDAEIAIDVTNYNAASQVFFLQYTTFNKNYIDINIDNFQTFLVANPFMIDNCVFTCRNFAFTATNWPTTDVNTGLRYTPNSSGLTVPYLQPVSTTAVITNLKGPYFNQPSHIAIRLNDVAFSNPPNYLGLSFGSANTNDFNLFDAHGTYISALNSNVSCFNNVFQSTQRYQTSPGVWEGGSAIRHETNTTLNTQLDLRSTSFAIGNRFWDCHTAIDATDVYNFGISFAWFRSNQNIYPTPGYLPGNTGIGITTNRFEYEIGTNVFNNINDCINISLAPGNYNMSGTPMSGIYAFQLKINDNYFGPQVSGGIPLSNGEYLNRAVRVSGPNSATWQQSNNMEIQSNRVDRGYRGILVNEMASYPTNIEANIIELIDDNWILLQNGIELTNTQDNVVVRNNQLSGPGSLNNNMSMVYCQNNNGTSNSPDIHCNDVMNSYNGFVFEGPNGAAVWKGNTMQNHARGYVLANSGVIGQQGSSGNPSDNAWLGTWAGTDVQTYVLNSDALLSPLYVIFLSPTLDPTIHGGSIAPFTTYAATGAKVNASTGSFSCPPSTLPSPPSYREAGPATAVKTVDEETMWSANVFPNPNQGLMYIQSSAESEALDVKVVDVAGKEIYERTLLTAKHTAAVELNLEQGVYFMMIRNTDTGTLVVKRIIIAK